MRSRDRAHEHRAVQAEVERRRAEIAAWGPVATDAEYEAWQIAYAELLSAEYRMACLEHSYLRDYAGDPDAMAKPYPEQAAEFSWGEL